MRPSASTVLRAEGISKSFRDRGFRDLMPWRAAESRGSDARVALHPLDLILERGSSVGIIGPNGAGKSTLLRLLAGLARPTAGRLEVRGSRRSLLDLGAGMIEELSGRQNALLQLGLDGLGTRDSERRWDGILEFSGLGRFAEAPLRTYSSGMRVRLAYAVAAAIPCEVLVADEVLAVGDEEFQRRCSHHVRDFLAAGGSLVLASHNLYHVEKLCSDAIWLHEGRVRARGPAREVTGAYRAWIDAADATSSREWAGDGQAGSTRTPSLFDEAPVPTTGPDGHTPLVSLRLFCDGLPTTRLREGEGFEARFSTALLPGSRLEVVRASGVGVLSIPVTGTALRVAPLPLLPGRYRVRLSDGRGRSPRLDGDVEFDCVGSSRELGCVRLRHAWREETLA